MLKIGELLVGEASRFAQRSGRAFPADCGVLIGEAALEGHENVAAAVNIVGDLLQQGIIGNIERWNDEQLVLREVGTLWKDEVRTHVGLIKSCLLYTSPSPR